MRKLAAAAAVLLLSALVRADSRDFERQMRQQAATDRTWRTASEGFMRMEKISYRSAAGHLYEHYIPYVRDAIARGFVVIAPEYRGSIGYGEKHYDAIDYGGAEVDDVVTAVDVEIAGGAAIGDLLHSHV